MGCDIHMHTERFVDGHWDHIGRGPQDDRNYALFWVLGEVRYGSPNPPIGSYRGIPDDASSEVKEDADSWDSDAHSASWLSVAEMQRWIDIHPDQREHDGGHFWDVELPKLATIDPNTAHVRIVFWFDN